MDVRATSGPCFSFVSIHKVKAQRQRENGEEQEKKEFPRREPWKESRVGNECASVCTSAPHGGAGRKGRSRNERGEIIKMGRRERGEEDWSFESPFF